MLKDINSHTWHWEETQNCILLHIMFAKSLITLLKLMEDATSFSIVRSVRFACLVL